MRANRRSLEPLFTQLTEFRQAALGQERQTPAKGHEASFVKAMDVFKAELNLLQRDLVEALGKKTQDLSVLDIALDEAVKASSVYNMAEHNEGGDLEARLKAVLAHSDAIYVEVEDQQFRTHKLHATALEDIHAFLNPGKPWQAIETNCTFDEYESDLTARLEALKVRLNSIGTTLHELKKQEGRRFWSNKCIGLYNRAVELEDSLLSMQDLMDEKDRFVEELNAQLRQVRGLLVGLGWVDEDEGVEAAD